jgi:anti-anti-sigma regulatory factor
MINVNVEKLGELRVIECDGRIVRSEAAFALRDSVTSQSDARVIILDLSEVNALEGGGLGMLMFLQRWAQDHHIHLKLFNPRNAVRARLQRTNASKAFEIVSLEDLLDLLARAEHGYPLAA